MVVRLVLSICMPAASCGLIGCGEDYEDGVVSVRTRADYGALAKRLAAHECPGSAGEDHPDYGAGLDCDGDGGVITLVTPSQFKVACKRLSIIHEDGTVHDVIPDVGSLSDAQVVDLATEVSVADIVLAGGRYNQWEAEFYYYEMVIPVGSPAVDRTVRIYLGDDDFPQEGNGGHHQGDITLISASGQELGFVMPAHTWDIANLAPSRGEIMGSGGVDPETGHMRGLYGDAGMWNQQQFQQGASRDIYILVGGLDLVVDGDGATLVLRFDLAETWFFEDFDGSGTFNPCEDSIEACSAGAAWSPILYPPVATVR